MAFCISQEIYIDHMLPFASDCQQHDVECAGAAPSRHRLAVARCSLQAA